MKVYIVRTEKKIDPFDEHVGNCLVGNKTLKILQNEILLSLGLHPIWVIGDLPNDTEEHIIFNDNLYFSKALLKEFIIRSKQQQNITNCALKSDITTCRTVIATQEVKIHSDCVEYNLRYFPRKNLRKNASQQLLVINPDELHAGISVPKHICNTEMYFVPITDKFIIQIDHWVNLWAANISMALSRAIKLRNSSKTKLLFLSIWAHSFNKWNLLRRYNQIGQNCDVHPAACVEGSIIGDNVVIGAGAVIRESIVGDNCHVGNNVVVEQSVIGNKSTVLHGHILYSVFYPGVFSVAQFIPASLIGKNAFMGSDATITDFRFDGQNGIVIKNGEKVDTGNTFIGCCLGYNAYLGSGCIVAPGRIIPNNIRIALDKKRVISNGFSKKMEEFRLI